MNKLDFLVIDFGLFCILSYCYKDKKSSWFNILGKIFNGYGSCMKKVMCFFDLFW